MIPEEFRELLPPPPTHKLPEYDGPLYYLWVFDPQTGQVVVEHNKDRHKADAIGHDDLARQVAHPDRIHGYAYHVLNGWRITTEDHKPLDDPFIVNQITTALAGEQQPEQEQTLEPHEDWHTAKLHYGKLIR